MQEPQPRPIEHCPRFPDHCSLECMERMRAEFGSYAELDRDGSVLRHLLQNS